MASSVEAPRVVLVMGDGCAKAGAAAMYTAQAAYDHAKQSLSAAYVPYRTSSDEKVVRLGIGPQRVAIFPYNSVMLEGEVERLAAWVSSGGRAIFIHALPQGAARVLGLPEPYPVQVATPAEYQTMVLPAGKVLGLPHMVVVSPRWLNRVEATQGVGRIGFFVSENGRAQSEAPVFLTPRGAYITCLLTTASPRQAGALLRALAGHFDPELWRVIVPNNPTLLGPVEGAGTLGALLSYLSHQPSDALHIARSLRAAREAEQAAERARGYLSQGMGIEAADLATAARDAANRAYWMAWPTREEELRGVWASNTAVPSWDGAAATLAAARINVVFPYMASAAAAYYSSGVLPTADGARAGEDDLAQAVKACHAHGLKLHVRMLGLSCLFSTTQTRQALANAGRLMVDTQGNTKPWLCPSNPRNREMLIAAAAEMSSKYPVDGLQLDYFRFPGGDVCTCGHCRAGFEKLLGRRTTDWPRCVTGPARDLFMQFRRRQLMSLLAEIRQAVHKVRPGLPISAAVFVNWPDHRDTFGQDWVPWLRAGLIDFACPMNYTANVEQFAEWVAKQRQWAGDKPLCAGIGPYADRVGDFPPLIVARQITVARKYTEGWVLFNLRPELLEDHIPRMALGLCYAPSRLPRWAGGQG